MNSPNPIALEAPVQPLAAPFRLTSHHRLDFRREVLEALETAATAGAPTVDVDLSRTIEMDASGLGVLVLLQKRARERGLRTRLLCTPHAVREMLLMTRLDALFEFANEA
jgi:anti-anti-sigma factor